MTLHKKAGMWISDWGGQEGDDEGCYKRQREQFAKAFKLLNKMEDQGWKEIGYSGIQYKDKGLDKSEKILKDNIPQIKQAIKSHNADVKKQWGKKKVNMWDKSLASGYFTIDPDWLFGGGSYDRMLEMLSYGELGGLAALMNKGNQYRLIFTNGSDDDENGYWSKPVVQLAFKSTAAKAKPKAKPIMSGKGQQYVMKGTGRGVRKTPAKKTTTRKSKPKAKTGRKAPTISATKRKIGTRMRGNDGKMWEVKKSGKSQRWMAGAESFEAENMETFEAPRRKRLDFDWIGEDSSDKEWARSGSNTIAAATKKAKAEGWKPVMSEYWGDNAATEKSRMRREAKVWNLMSKSPQWKPWLKFLTERDADNEMHETMDIFRGKAYWKAKNRNSVSILGTTQDYGPWIYDEDRIYVPDHFSEDGGWQVLVKGNQALLLYYIADYDGPYTTPLMRKTFTISTKPVAKAKPKRAPARKPAAKKPKAKAKPKTKYILGKKDRPTDLKKRKSPPYSAKQFPKGARKKGNNGKMWTIVTDKRGVKRWKA